MIQVGKSVPNGNAGMLREQLDCLLLEAAELDAVIEAAEDLRGVLKGFLLAHLAVGKEGHVRALIIGSDLERAAGAGGGFLEKQNDVLAGKQIAADTGALLRLQVGSEVKQITDLVGSEVLQSQQGTALKIDRHGRSPLYFLCRKGLLIPRRRIFKQYDYITAFTA